VITRLRASFGRSVRVPTAPVLHQIEEVVRLLSCSRYRTSYPVLSGCVRSTHERLVPPGVAQLTLLPELGRGAAVGI
jgi:hypothetical protein